MRRKAINSVRDCQETLSNAVAMKLIESGLIETVNKAAIEEQIGFCLEKLTRSDDFDIDYNQYKYLMETRISGALIRPKSALVIEQVVV